MLMMPSLVFTDIGIDEIVTNTQKDTQSSGCTSSQTSVVRYVTWKGHTCHLLTSQIGRSRRLLLKSADGTVTGNLFLCSMQSAVSTGMRRGWHQYWPAG